MHRSRVFGLFIDTPTAQAPAAAAFWAAALGVPAQPDAAEPEFTTLVGGLPGLHAAVQAVDDPARYHLDIETDDVDAEVARLVGLGATEVSSWQGCRTLQTPGGHLLCVIPLHSDPDDFDRHAHTWT